MLRSRKKENSKAETAARVFVSADANSNALMKRDVDERPCGAG